MVQRRRGKSKKMMGNHQRSWLWGRNLVTEILEAGRWAPLELHLDAALDPAALTRATQRAETLGARVHIEPAERLRQLCGSGEHQGHLARMSPYPYEEAPALAARLLDAPDAAPFLVYLDGIQDPFNFGAILRSAEVFGADAVFCPARGQAEVNSLVARASAGAVCRLPIARAAEPAALFALLAERGVPLWVATEKSGYNSREATFAPPLALALGNEGRGPSHELLEAATERVAIPQQGAIGSLNVAAAAAVLFYEVAGDRALKAGPRK